MQRVPHSRRRTAFPRPPHGDDALARMFTFVPKCAALRCVRTLQKYMLYDVIYICTKVETYVVSKKASFVHRKVPPNHTERLLARAERRDFGDESLLDENPKHIYFTDFTKSGSHTTNNMKRDTRETIRRDISPPTRRTNVVYFPRQPCDASMRLYNTNHQQCETVHRSAVVHKRARGQHKPQAHRIAYMQTYTHTCTYHICERRECASQSSLIKYMLACTAAVLSQTIREARAHDTKGYLFDAISHRTRLLYIYIRVHERISDWFSEFGMLLLLLARRESHTTTHTHHISLHVCCVCAGAHVRGGGGQQRRPLPHHTQPPWYGCFK